MQLDYAINEEMFKFAMTCKALMLKGWDFVEFKYGEERLLIGPSLTIKRGDVVRIINDYNQAFSILEEDFIV